MTARHEQGFSLVEAIVALAIVAALTSAFLASLAHAARLESAANLRARAVLLAQSALDRAVAGEPARSGRAQDLGWQVSTKPYGQNDPLDRARLEEIAVAVGTDPAHPLVQLRTIRVRP
ncbi:MULTISPECIES: prepilin-type N-terminal cleavage/methylation domain-containing protein [unclassified Sphingomonas]|uniref:prepilin-type N-terminal cleavage/methylation domain-containing protein n=1 Tax=Novosphingobium rhizosphaerae TaxID=1551649 RepID=UPI0015CE3852